MFLLLQPSDEPTVDGCAVQDVEHLTVRQVSRIINSYVQYVHY